ncbi:fructosamine kinase family protein [Saccharothrix sp. Mg75]|uniref:fructosamine kinase family protein n=1 Tax=Saccharothrix sp. Mg75 TaxID=3445357 RepID=UPI003EECD90F
MTPAGAAARLTGVPAAGARRIAGAVWEVGLADGGRVVVKRHDVPGAALAEAASLAWLAEPDGPPVPGVRGHDRRLCVDRVEPGRPSPGAAEDFGRAPARLHGDLWGGNAHWAADGRAWLIDPAAHGGHRETDLAMLDLFGCPHLDRVLAAYHEVSPLEPGRRDRVPLHQLFPLLVHAALFGREYARQALSVARALT